MKTFAIMKGLWISACFLGAIACSDIQANFNKLNMNVADQALKREKEKAAILAVIENESKAFWDKDYDKWASYWMHAPYIRTMGWWELGGVTVVKGWQERGPRTKTHMANNPDPNPQNVTRKNINMRIAEDMAWVTFDQYGKDTGEPDMDMPGLSRETRILEKHEGQWKIVYVGWLLEGTSK